MSSRSMFDGLRRLLGRLRQDDRGVAAVQFALVAVPLSVTIFGVIDVSRASTERVRLQDALDAAALAAARSTATTNTQVQTIGSQVLAADMANGKATLRSAAFTIQGDKVVAVATASITPIIAGVWLDGDMALNAGTEVTRASNNLEVSLVLDVTGSMSGQKITDLKTAAKDLVDLVVHDTQTPYYSKAALVPYSAAVNVGTYASQIRGSYSSGTCTSAGCQKYTFTSAAGSSKTFAITNCVTERTGAEAFTDAAPGVVPLGRHYAGSNNPCLSAGIMPLTSDKAALKTRIDSLQASGSTAGHIGLGWGWYMISPNFASLWPQASQPGAYGAEKLMKVVVLMTDGAFNTAYCNGVVSRDSGSGSGSASDHINCNAPNGDAFAQALSLCANMKAAGVTIYTVGFDVATDRRAQDLVSQCASDAEHVYLPTSGSDLRLAFRAIGEDISALRLSR